jgi:thiol:disulfide interchange protein DsbD
LGYAESDPTQRRLFPLAIPDPSIMSVSMPVSVSASASVLQRWRRLLPVLALLGLAVTAQHAGAAQDFLEPDQAFRLTARVAEPGVVELRYAIAPGYYMYRERLAFGAAPQGTQLGEPRVPPGKVKFDDTFQKNVEIYHGDLVIPVPVQAAPALFKLEVTGQGCAEKGLCYPPRKQAFKVEVAGGAIKRVALMGDDDGEAWQPPAGAVVALAGGTPAATATPQSTTAPGSTTLTSALTGGPAAAAAATAATPASDQGSIETALKAGNLLGVVGVFLLAGLLLSFTPCVLPMVPILSSIIVGQGAQVSRLRGFLLSLSYALGMALVYTAFGVAAGLAGEGLAAALQNPWVLGSFALLLVLLSLSMFGLYELQLPSALQSRLSEGSSRLQGGNYTGVLVMGGISALIVGPCVAAPLAGALVYISQTRDVVIGGVALFSLACGMSVPLLLVGLSAGSLLPRAGAWMEGVKRFFGALLIAVAIWMVSPVVPAWAAMALWGLLLLVCASYLQVFDRLPDGSSGWRRLAKGLGVVMALAGSAQVVGALSGGHDVLQPLGHLAVRGAGAGGASAAAEGLSFRRVTTVAELDAITATAAKPVMLDFYADWCVSCKEMEHFTFRDERVRTRLAGAVLLQADVTANSDADKALLKRFGLFGPPGIVFYDRTGQLLASPRVIGYQDGDAFLASLSSAGI